MGGLRGNQKSGPDRNREPSITRLSLSHSSTTWSVISDVLAYLLVVFSSEYPFQTEMELVVQSEFSWESIMPCRIAAAAAAAATSATLFLFKLLKRSPSGAHLEIGPGLNSRRI